MTPTPKTHRCQLLSIYVYIIQYLLYVQYICGWSLRWGSSAIDRLAASRRSSQCAPTGGSCTASSRIILLSEGVVFDGVHLPKNRRMDTARPDGFRFQIYDLLDDPFLFSFGLPKENTVRFV